MSKPTIVLVHGSFGDASSWRSVFDILDGDEYTVLAPANPLRGLANDASYLEGLIDQLNGPVVLVGHSYGGAVISAAGVHPNATHLVYLCAFALEVGESASQNSLQGGDDAGELGAAIVVADNVYAVDPDRAVAAFFHDCAPDVAAAAVERLRPQSIASLAGEVEAAAWRDKPATYVVCTDDRALPVALQRSNAARVGTSIDWPTSHSPFLSRPELVADLVAELSSR